MGHKVSPLAFRIGYIKSWRSNGFYDKKSYGRHVSSDVAIRSVVTKHYKGLPLANIFINHSGDNTVSITIYTSRTALVLGNDDENINALKALLEKKYPEYNFTLEVKEVKKPELSASIVADSIARQIEKKMPYRRVIKNAIARTMEKGGLGVKVKLGGRLNGAEIARKETYKDGSIPTQTIRADVDFAYERAETTAGTIGIKVWIFKGNVFKK
ncbi:30S ribosomal protein S3 [Candidatus Gracilibacteria bacterium GN02-873]|nr:30S ribosomal protein S3 [Candidatus Gracilibacteria bacterium]RAL55407.1 30S ribosomal protein S3 [Candidatus Gracilibacteria bacterium GN02-873]